VALGLAWDVKMAAVVLFLELWLGICVRLLARLLTIRSPWSVSVFKRQTTGNNSSEAELLSGCCEDLHYRIRIYTIELQACRHDCRKELELP